MADKTEPRKLMIIEPLCRGRERYHRTTPATQEQPLEPCHLAHRSATQSDDFASFRFVRDRA